MCNQLLLALGLHSVSTELFFANLTTIREPGSVINKEVCGFNAVKYFQSLASTDADFGGSKNLELIFPT